MPISAGISVHGGYVFYDEKRIEIAKNYLTQTNLTISQIAEKLSFADRNYFSSVFKLIYLALCFILNSFANECY